MTKNAVVFSHEQGSGSKNVSANMGEVSLQHLVSSRGDIVSDNASVGKNWTCTVALPQYFVGQGLAPIAMMALLEKSMGTC